MRCIFALSLLLVAAGCENPFGSDPEHVELRVYNDSEHLYERVTVNGVPFGDVAGGRFSSYHVVEGAYRYGAIGLYIGETQYGLTPIDYVGETPLRPGRYTYVISADITTRRLELSFYEGDAVPRPRVRRAITFID